MAKIDVNGTTVGVVKVGGEDYLSLTDMLRSKNGDFLFHNWLRNRNTVEFLGTWEKVFNPKFNTVEFDIIKSKAGLNNFRLSAKEWSEKTSAIGIVSKAGQRVANGQSGPQWKHSGLRYHQSTHLPFQHGKHERVFH